MRKIAYIVALISTCLHIPQILFAQTMVTSQNNAQMQSCLQNFNPTTHLPALAREIGSSGGPSGMLIEYAQCDAFAQRRAQPCELLSPLRGNSSSVCKNNFARLIFWRDLASGVTEDRLDALDLIPCKTFSKNWYHTAQKSRQICRAILQAHASGAPLCQSFPKLLGMSPEAVAHCAEFVASYSDRQGKSEVNNFTAAMMSRLSTKTSPACGEYPFNSSFGAGMCQGTFESGSCDKMLIPLRDAYCNMTLNKPKPKRYRHPTKKQ